MAITSVGYGGTVTEVGWTSLASQFGSDYSVVGADDFRVSAATSPARSVAVAPGAAYGNGVHDYSDSTVTLTATSLGGSSRWDTVAIRRNWQGQGGSTSLVLLPGSTARSVSTARQTQPGTIADQPIALVQFTSASSTPAAIVDLRVWSGNGGLVGSSPEVRQYLDRPGTVVNINGTQWVREFSSAGSLTWTEMGAQYITTATANNRFMTPAQAGARFVEQDTGLISVFSSNDHLWSRSLRWYKTGQMVTVIGRPLRQSSATSLTSPGSNSTLYRLPSSLRPTVQYRTTALSRRNSYKRHGIFIITIETDGRIYIYNSDPSYNIIPGTSYFFETSFRTP